MVVLTSNSHFVGISMAFHDDDEKEKEIGVVSDEALGEVLDEDADPDEVPVVPLEDDEKAWE